MIFGTDVATAVRLRDISHGGSQKRVEILCYQKNGRHIDRGALFVLEEIIHVVCLSCRSERKLFMKHAIKIYIRTDGTNYGRG
jgi:hypothetical protein